MIVRKRKSIQSTVAILFSSSMIVLDQMRIQVCYTGHSIATFELVAAGNKYSCYCDFYDLYAAKQCTVMRHFQNFTSVYLQVYFLVLVMSTYFCHAYYSGS